MFNAFYKLPEESLDYWIKKIYNVEKVDWQEFSNILEKGCEKSNPPTKNLVKEDKEKFVIKIPILSLKKEFLKVELKGEELFVKYSLPKDSKLDSFETHSFDESWVVPKQTNKDDIRVSYEGGVLNVLIQKHKPPQPQSIEIPIEIKT
jgi:HSP20 family molecular chaperone IbpA